MDIIIEDRYGLDDVVRKAIEYISKEIHEPFNTDTDTKWTIGKKDEEVKRHLLEIDDVSRKRIVLKLLLSEQIYSLIEMMQCINGGIVKGTHSLMRNIYECIIHIETFKNYPHNSNIFKNWVKGKTDWRWRHKNELAFLKKVRKDKSTVIERQTYDVLSSFAHPTIHSNIRTLSKYRSSGVYMVNKNWLYQSVMMVIDGCKYVCDFCGEKEDVMQKLRQFWNGIGQLVMRIILERSR